MSTLTVPDLHETGTGFEPVHGAHTSCQWGQEKVTAICGAQCDWDEQRDTPQPGDECVVCLDLMRCPVCGCKLGMPS